jgi:peptidyl-prolyl cis-trans isomerase SurA
VVINDDLRATVKNRILQDSRSNKSKESFIERIKKENNFKESIDKKAKTTPVEDFYAVVGNSILEGEWKVSQANTLTKNIFSFAGKNYNQQDFAKYLEEIQGQFQNVKKEDVDTKILVNYAYRQFVENTIIDYEDARLEEKYPDFAQLMQEYKEGILIYELSEVKIWRKAVTDSVGLEAFYETVKDHHLYPVRVRAEYYKAVDYASGKTLTSMLVKKTPADKIMAKMNKKSITVVLDTVTYWEGQNKVFDNLFNWKDAVNGGVISQASDSLENEAIRVQEVLQPSVKPLDEVRGVVISEYQQFLEKEWLENIRKNNAVWIDYDAILSLIKK